MKKIVINAKQLSTDPRLTGIQRVCREIILRLDGLLEQEKDLVVEYAYPEGSPNAIINPSEFKNIVPVTFKRHKRFTARFQLWELPRYLKKEKALGATIALDMLCYKHSVSAVYDLRPLLFSQYDGASFQRNFKFMMKVIAKYSRKIVTDSNYQKRDICKHLKKREDEVETIYLGWEHMQSLDAQAGAIDGIEKGNYYYTVGSLAPHKNFKWIIEVAQKHPEQQFVIAGAKDLDAWGDLYKDVRLPNVQFVGYVSDETSKYLMQNCKAFIFPSKYEGFGLPPLEALSVGAKVLCSNATCLPEIFEDCVGYFDPDDTAVNLDDLLQTEVAPPEKILQKCSWDTAAKRWLEILKEEVEKIGK